jgi:hypothetical protein
MSARDAKAQAKAAKAHAKAMRPWFKKKRVMLPLVLVVIIGIAVAASGGGDDTDKTSTASGENQTVHDKNSSEANLWDRPDEKKGDKERELGQAADLSGYTATVTSAATQQSIDSFEDDGYLVAEVTLLNRDKSAQSYNPFDWKLITPSGTIIDPCICGAEQLGSGDLTSGGTVSGRLIFETKGAPGDYYVIFDPPDIANDNRGVWKATA